MTHYSQAVLDLPFEHVARLIRAQVAEHDMPVEDASHEIRAHMPYGAFGAKAQDAQTVIFVECADENTVFTVQDGISTQISAVMPDLKIRWSLRLPEGALRPEFQTARVESVTELTSSFLRVRLRGGDIPRLAGDMIHFRLLLPPDPDHPVWPRIAAGGTTAWPKGDDALHMPVYTTRYIGEDWLDFDIFRHEGGKTMIWAQSGPEDQVIGLMGPGGGGLPMAEKILFAGDETALPAIARMLEDPRCPEDVQVLLSDGDWDYRIDHPYERCADLSAAVIEAMSPDRFTWMGAGRAQVQPVRKQARKNGFERTMMHLVNYWT